MDSTARTPDEEKYLPKEPLDLPKEALDLPLPPAFLPEEPLGLAKGEGHTAEGGEQRKVHEHSSPHHQETHHQEYQKHQESQEFHHQKNQPSHNQGSQYSHPNDYQVRTLLSWHGAGRPYKKKGSTFLANIALITLFIEIILFLFGQYLLMVVIFFLAFMSVAFAIVPPRDVYYKISSEGVMVGEHFFLWQELYDFYFKRVEGQDVAYIRTKMLLPSEVVIVLGDIHREQIKSAMLPYLPFREYVRPTFMEKSGDWLGRNFPLEKVSHN